MPGNNINVDMAAMAAQVAAEEPRFRNAPEPVFGEVIGARFGNYIVDRDMNGNNEERDMQEQEMLSLKNGAELLYQSILNNRNYLEKRKQSISNSKTYELIKDSPKVTPASVSGYLNFHKVLINRHENYQDFRERSGTFSNLNNGILLFNCLLAKFGEELTKDQRIKDQILAIYKSLSNTVGIIRNNERDDRILLKIKHTDLEAITYINDFTQKIKPLVEAYKGKFGIIELSDSCKILKQNKETLYPKEHLYYITNIDEYWGRYISSGIHINKLYDLIRETCNGFIRLADPIYILNEEDVNKLKPFASEFLTIAEARKKFKDIKFEDNLA